MTHQLRLVSSLLLALTAVSPTVSWGQQGSPVANDQIMATAPLPQAQLDALLAPIALYPDQLLAQVLMASTYPLDVAQAARFVQQNPSLKGDALDRALQDQNWDPSVLSLTAYPQVLLMMNDMPDWTQQVGNAFLANQQQVMDTVQQLRSRAQAAGNLQSTPQQSVMNQGGFIDIEPTQPQYVYVPVYDPTVIYGPWSDPVYVPPYWYPPPIYGYPEIVPGFAAGVFFGAACGVSPNHWGWARPNWRGRDININVSNNYFANRPRYVEGWRDGRWAHVPEERHGVASRDNAPQNGYGRPFNAATQPREAFQARNLAQPEHAVARPLPQMQQPTARLSWPQPTARPMPQPVQMIARPLHQAQQPIARSAPQFPQPMARPMPQPHQTMARSLPQVRPSTMQLSWHQPTARPTPQPAPTLIRSMPREPQALARPVPQPRVQQVVYGPKPPAQVQVAASHGAAPSKPGRGQR